MRSAFLSLALLLAVPTASGQDVVGTWELVEAENVPYEDSLVFARMTFTDDVLRSAFVFLDPDDGELIGRLHEDRYLISDGQLIVRSAGSTTVLDVDREGDRLAVLDLQTGVQFQMQAADPARDSSLLGRWRGTREGRPLTLHFHPEGALEVQEGDEEPKTQSYMVAGPYLLLDDEPFRYTVSQGDDGGLRLRLDVEGEQTEFLLVDR